MIALSVVSSAMGGAVIPLVLLFRARSEAKFQKAMSDFWFGQYKTLHDAHKAASDSDRVAA